MSLHFIGDSLDTSNTQENILYFNREWFYFFPYGTFWTNVVMAVFSFIAMCVSGCNTSYRDRDRPYILHVRSKSLCCNAFAFLLSTSGLAGVYFYDLLILNNWSPSRKPEAAVTIGYVTCLALQLSAISCLGSNIRTLGAGKYTDEMEIRAVKGRYGATLEVISYFYNAAIWLYV